MGLTAFTRLVFFLFLFCPLAESAEPVSGGKPLQVIDFQLRWNHQFQFAGYYAAIEQGYYREAGFDVRLHEGGPGKSPVDEVLSGRARYAQGNSEVLYERLKGKPLVALAAIFQHSPSVLLVREKSGIRTPHDLVGRNVMLMNGESDSDFLAMFLREGIKLKNINILPSSHDIDDLISGKVDAFNSYLTNEPFFLKQRGIDYAVINPSIYGIDYYSDILFTSEQELKDHPDRVEAFRVASLRGWQYALNHPAEIIDLLIGKYRVIKSRSHLRFEADAMRSFVLSDIVEIGHMNPGRWQSMAEAFKVSGMVDPKASLDGFVYDPNPRIQQARIRNLVIVFIAIIGAALVTLMITMYFLTRFRKEVELRKKIEAKLSDTNELLQRTGKVAKVGGWELNLENDQLVWTKEAAIIREIPPETVLTYEQALAFYDPETRTVLNALKDEAIRDGSAWEEESLMTTASGKKIWVSNRGEAVVRDGKTVMLTGTIQDITERKLAELGLLRRSSELEMHNGILKLVNLGAPLPQMFEAMVRKIETLHPEMLCMILVVDEEGTQLRIAAAPSMPDFFIQVVDGLLVGDGAGCCGTAAFRGERVIAEDLQQHPYCETLRAVSARANLRSCWSQPIKNHTGCVLGVFTIYHRVTARPSDEKITLIETYASLVEMAIQRHLSEERIRNLAYYDALTQLPNRRMLDDRLSQAMAVSKRSGRYGALMFLDLDNFKPLNDSHGHAVGDLLLIQVAQRISGCIREMDTVARFGGDEFVIMLSELDESRDESAIQARRVAEKVRSLLAQPYLLTVKQNGTSDVSIEHRCTASIGLTLFINHDATLDDILKWADAAMYQAKDAGRDSICFHD